MHDLILEIDPQEVLRLQGYRRPSDIPTPDVLAILQDAMAEVKEALEISEGLKDDTGEADALRGLGYIE
jgi:hypothetical protein